MSRVIGGAVKRFARSRKKEQVTVVHGNPFKTYIRAGQAAPSPPLGPQLGERGINAANFCKEFNKKTEHIIEGVPLPTRIYIKPDRTYEFEFQTPPTAWLLKQAAGVSKGSGKVGELAGMVTLKHVYEIARVKVQDPVNMGTPLETMCRMIIKSATRCGIKVVKEIDPEQYLVFLKEREKYLIELQQKMIEEKKAKLLKTA
ncbi:unnamed protein product [Soboliphyme baturini]|uniref:Large ribosomal subunit protein uL11m n=1 Tax=Soboliphyme baturini TaxID=241478 RepID=A0A183J3G3_9BILA|nr:unnamed protein product [Soboliphyme baturini]